VYTLTGSIDEPGAAALRDHIVSQVQGGVVHFIIDLSGVDFIDSAGLGMLVANLKTVYSRNGSIKLVNPSNEVLHVFEITRLVKVFSIYPTVEAALLNQTRV
jgi:anti-sigma B factor antagonist